VSGLHKSEHDENIAACECQPAPHPLSRTETYPGAGAAVSESIAVPWQYNAQRFLKTNLQIDRYYPLVTPEEYKYIQCGCKKQSMKTYYDNVLKKENTAQRFPSFKTEMASSSLSQEYQIIWLWGSAKYTVSRICDEMTISNVLSNTGV
jgi:hypothetical protein